MSATNNVKLLIISSSPRKDGNSRIVAEIARRIALEEDKDVQAKTLDVNDYNTYGCDCRRCAQFISASLSFNENRRAR